VLVATLRALARDIGRVAPLASGATCQRRRAPANGQSIFYSQWDTSRRHATLCGM